MFYINLYYLNLLMYNLYMTDISITEARADLAAVIRRAKKKPVRITNHGKPQAVLVDPSFYERMIEALEDIDDVRAFDEAIKDKTPGVPWEQVKRELGLS